MESDEEYAEIGWKYAAGELLTGEVKKICIETLQAFVKDYQERRAQVTDEDVENFMKIRPIDPMSSKMPKPQPEEAKNE